VDGAVHPAGLGHQLAGGEADIDMPPAALPVAPVEPRPKLSAASAAAPPADLGPELDHQPTAVLVVTIDEFPAADDHRPAQAEQLA
jgi:hypothetical protein